MLQEFFMYGILCWCSKVACTSYQLCIWYQYGYFERNVSSLSQMWFERSLPTWAFVFSVLDKSNYWERQCVCLPDGQVPCAGAEQDADVHYRYAQRPRRGRNRIRSCGVPPPSTPAVTRSFSRAGLSQGYELRLNVTVPQATLHILFPEAAVWYLTLQTLCPGNARWGREVFPKRR